MFSSVGCVLLRFTLPFLTFDAVQKVLSTITLLVDELLETEVVSDPFNMLCIFNAPQHLFVSSRLAVQFPHSLESVLISSYNTCIPTSALQMIGVTNGLDSNKLSGDKNKINLWTTFNSYCKRLGTIPFFLQRIVVRLVQPVVLTGVTTLFAFINIDVVYSAVIFILLIISTFLVWYFSIRLKERSDHRSANASVTPLMDFGYIFDHKDILGSSYSSEDEESSNVDFFSYCSSKPSKDESSDSSEKSQPEDNSNYSSVLSSDESSSSSSKVVKDSIQNTNDNDDTNDNVDNNISDAKSQTSSQGTTNSNEGESFQGPIGPSVQSDDHDVNNDSNDSDVNFDSLSDDNEDLVYQSPNSGDEEDEWSSDEASSDDTEA